MRILYIVNSMTHGGAELQLRDRAATLVRRGHQIAIVSMMPFRAFESWLQDAGVSTFTLGLTGRNDAIPSVARYTRILRNFRPDVVHAHLFVALLFARMVRLLPPTVRGNWRVLVCSSHTQKEIVPGRYLAYRLTQPLGDAWTCAAREGIATHEALGAVPKGFARWAPNGVDLALFRPDASIRSEMRSEMQVDNSFVWVAVGSFRDDMKDYDNMLQAFAKVSERSMLLIAGDGALLDAKRALAGSLGIVSRVRFLGQREDVPRLLQAADAYVLSSSREAMPNVVLQAAASGLPVVTTDVGEAAAIIVHEEGGYVVPPRDSPRLAAAMRRVEELEPVARSRMGAAARAYVAEHFDFERVVDRWVALYEELLTTKASPRPRTAPPSKPET